MDFEKKVHMLSLLAGSFQPSSYFILHSPIFSPQFLKQTGRDS